MRNSSSLSLRAQRSNPWIATSLALLAMTLTQPASAEEYAYRTITVTGDANVKKAPDKATISISIEEESEDLAAAKKATDDQLEALYSIAKNAGIAEKDMQTTYSSIQPVYDYNNGTRSFRSYNVNHQVELTLKQPDKVAALTEKLLAAKIDQINNVTYGLQEEDDAQSEALKKALAKAKTKAQMMASSLGESVDRVLQINESGVSFQPLPIMMRKSMMMSGAPMAEDASVAPPTGEIAINANVTVTFSLK